MCDLPHAVQVQVPKCRLVEKLSGQTAAALPRIELALF
jgi:hypothetical protein